MKIRVYFYLVSLSMKVFNLRKYLPPFLIEHSNFKINIIREVHSLQIKCYSKLSNCIQ